MDPGYNAANRFRFKKQETREPMKTSKLEKQQTGTRAKATESSHATNVHDTCNKFIEHGHPWFAFVIEFAHAVRPIIASLVPTAWPLWAWLQHLWRK